MSERQNSGAGQGILAYRPKFKRGYLSPRHWPAWLAVLLLYILYLLPAAVTDALASGLGDLALRINHKRRRIAEKNIALCFPELSQAERDGMLRQHFRAQVRSVLHYGFIWWAPPAVLERRIRLEGEAHIHQVLESGQPVIIMTGHSVGLEAAVSTISMHNSHVVGPFKQMKNPVINWIVARGRLRHGGALYTRDAGLRPIVRDVRGGSLMFYLPDEDLGKERSIFAPLFGVQKATIPVLGRLAQLCRAAVLPIISCYDQQSRCYRVHVLPPLEDFPRGDDLQDALVMNRALEETIALCPAQYFWTMKFFKTRPEGEDPIY